MSLSGEAIRTMNYVDDISVTLRRILAVLPALTPEERQRVASHIKQSEPSYDSVRHGVYWNQVMPAEEAPPKLLVFQKIAVIGAGAAGQAFARDCLKLGLAVALEDVMPSKLRRAAADLEERGVMHGSLSLVTTVEDAVRDADLAVDFVPDELESKLEIFSMLDRMAPPRTVLLTPTDALSITDLASCVYRTGCVGVRNLPLAQSLKGLTGVEVVSAPNTPPETVQAIAELLRSLGAEVAICPDPLEPAIKKNFASCSTPELL